MSRWMLTVVTVIGLILAIGSASAQTQTTLTIWDQFFPTEQSDLMNQLIVEFEAEHPGVQVNRSILDTDSIRAVLRTALTSGQGPDVFYYDAGPGFLGMLIKAGLVYDLTDVYVEYGWTNRVAEWAQQRVMDHGRIYGFPNEVEYTNVYYNKEILAKLGMSDKVIPYAEDPAIKTLHSFQDYLDIVKAAKVAGYIPTAFANRDPGRGGHLFSYFMELTAGREKIDDILFGDGRWDIQEVVQALQLIKDLDDMEGFPRNVNALGYDEGNALFFMGQAATHITGTWLIADILEQVPNPSVIDFLLLPPVSSDIPLRAAAGLGSTWAISANSKNKDLAVEFLDYVMSQENAKRWLEQASVIPPLNGLETADYDLPAMTSSAVAGLDLPQGHGYNLDVIMPASWNSVMMNGIQAIINDQKTAQQVAEEMQKAWAEAKSAGNIWKAR